MRSKTSRTIMLALMMITMSVLPLIGGAEERQELTDNRLLGIAFTQIEVL